MSGGLKGRLALFASLGVLGGISVAASAAARPIDSVYPRHQNSSSTHDPATSPDIQAYDRAKVAQLLKEGF
jgi:hypothetical protein